VVTPPAVALSLYYYCFRKFAVAVHPFT